MPFEKSLRWFGEADPVGLSDMREAGATSVVTALHHIPNGQVWPEAAIKSLLLKINKARLDWHVVESLPVHDSIKRGAPERDQHIQHYLTSMRHLAACGIDTICYNFMPVLDWVRTDIHFETPAGGESMLFDYPSFALFDIHILHRPGAKNDYPAAIIDQAAQLFDHLPDEQATQLAHTIIIETQGFIDGFTSESAEDYLPAFLEYLQTYQAIDTKQLRENLGYFLDQVIPLASTLGIKMAIHADDPAFPVLGLPRIVSTADDLEWIFNRQQSIHNGLTFCSGSLGSNQENDLVKIIDQFKNRIHFVHLRNMRFTDQRSFYESGHLDGDLDLITIIKSLQSDRVIPMRPDHGLKILDDRQRASNPGYPLIGRMKGLVEISAVEQVLRKRQ